MKNINDMTPLAIDLPEDVLRAKWCGDFTRCNRLISIYLNNPKVPECTKERLRIEEKIIAALPVDFQYTEEEAFQMTKEKISDLTYDEFENLIDTSAIEWIYINGKVYCQNRFLSTLLKVHPELAERAGLPKASESPARKELNKNIADMKKDGKSEWHMRLRAKLKLHDDAFVPNETLKVHLPIPKDAINMKNIKILSSSFEPKTIGSMSDPQRTIYFEEKLSENKQFDVEYEYDSVVNYIDLKDKKNIELAGKTEQPNFETQELYPHIRFTPFIKALCAELSGDEKNPVLLARRFYDYCTTKVTYSYMREYFLITEIPDYCGLGLKGDCGVQALLFITLCRCAGIPAKWQSGVYVNPYDVGCHDWAQFYIAPFGWLFADPSFGGSAFRAGDYERHDYYFGNLDPFRMVANSEYQGALIPEKKHLRVDPYDNQRGEAEYEDKGISYSERDCDWDLIECYKKEV